MNCEKYLQQIDDLIEDELDEKTADEVSLHILDCQNCASYFEMLEGEKQMYSHYLFEVEPPSSLLRQFQTKLEAETSTTVAGGFFSQIFAFLRFNPALITAAALVLLISVFSLISLVKEEQPFATVATTNNSPTIRMMLPPIKKFEPIDSTGSQEGKASIVRANADTAPKPLAIKQTVPLKTESQPKIKTEIPKLSEEQAQFKEIRNLEIETVKQIEKVELLLRSFRNARMIDGSEIYDIGFEKQQARKLLQTNVALRQKAETYGIFFTQEMLNKVEPYLLDIANLEIDSTPEQVLEIKERVKSQSIIASLQGY